MQMHSQQQLLRHPACREVQHEIVQFAGRKEKKKALTLIIYLGRGWGQTGNLSRYGKLPRFAWLQSSHFPGTERSRCWRGAMCLLLRSDTQGSLPAGKQVTAALIYLMEKKKKW